MSDHPKSVALIVPHTHWDREWRYPIWKNRALLERFMAELLDQLESDPAYTCFVLDGQCIAIEDHLEVHPADAPRIEALVRAGRLRIGPWYSLPDLYPLDGECLVRNLLLGRRFANRFGGHLGVGYNSFGWGQTAQFPQIYAGFGMDFIIAAKRVSVARAPHCEYWWEAPDGTRVLTTRLGQDARANGFFQMYLPVRHGMPYLSDAYRWDWGKSGAAIHRADVTHCDDDYFRLDAACGYHPERVRDAAQAAWDGMHETLVPEFRLIMCGSDFSGPLPVLTRIIRDAAAALPDIEFRMGTLEEYAAELHRRLDKSKVPVVIGELRDGPASHVSGNALATRIHLKQLNKKAENALIRRAEPLAAALSLLGTPWPGGVLRAAWKHLLGAHPHDSINGVTQDKTADDTAHRLAQALEIAEVVFEEGAAALAGKLDYAGFDPADQLLLLVNPRPVPVREVLKVAVDTPAEDAVWETGFAEADGTPLASQFVSRRERTCPVEDLEARPWPFYHDRHLLHLDTGVIPAGGYKLVRVTRRKQFNRRTEWWPEMRVADGTDLASSPHRMENEWLRVEVRGDGTFDLTDKPRDRVYPGLHWFEDTGDAGDYWAYYPPYENRTFTSRGLPARVWLEDNGPLAATIAIEIVMPVPARAVIPENAVRGDSRRVEETVPLRIVSRLTLKRGRRRLVLRTTVHNNAEDHRLRVMFPTGTAADHADSAGHFTVDHRPNIPPRDAEGAFWPEMQTLPQQMFVDASDATGGLAVVNNCLTEYQLHADESRTLALTLFRAMRNRICTEWRSSGHFPTQDGGQCLRELDYEYALYPHAGDWREGEVYAEAMALNAPPSVFQVSPHPQTTGELPSAASLFAVDGPLVLSCFKKSEDRDTFVLRLFNPVPETVTATLRLPCPVRNAWLANLDEERLEPLAADGNSVAVTAGPNKIITVEIAP
ncbi:MAG: alpha-mannosidase [Verrucomicrobia bacterium]|nr:alpha-mannosidase [Verrucomicrobiota bacterium]